MTWATPIFLALALGAGTAYSRIAGLMSESRRERRAAAEALAASPDPALAPGLVDAIFFIPRHHRGEIAQVLWSNLTGRPVAGRLAASPVALSLIPVVVTTWEEWKDRHPDTTVLELPDSYGARWNFEYRPGAADRARAGVDFPVWVKSTALPRKEEVFGLRVGDAARAYPVETVARAGLVNDELEGESLVVLADPESGAVRAYRRGPRWFRLGTGAGALLDEAGRVWRVTEEALVPEAGEAGLAPLPRLPGHLAFWFAWYGFFPHTSVYRGGGTGSSGPPPPRSARGPRGAGWGAATGAGSSTRSPAGRR